MMVIALYHGGLTAIDHMQIPIPTVVFGLLVAFTATAAHAQTKTPEAAPPVNAVATPKPTPIDLTLRPATAVSPTPADPTLRPAAAANPTPADPTLWPAMAAKPTPADLGLRPAVPAQTTPVDLSLHPPAAPHPAPVDMPLHSASEELKRVARWVTDSGDNAGLPYLLIDKVNAQVFAFNRTGQLQGAAPVLLGMARGDRMLAPNDAPMSAMPPQVRITPAGRFVSRLAKDSKGKELLVLDYDASLSLHPVVKGTPAERRAERLKSATAQDNRVSYGCINAPAAFYSTVVSPAFTGTKGIVYVLPETSPAGQLFGFQPASAAAVGAQQGSTAADAPAAQPAPAPVAK